MQRRPPEAPVHSGQLKCADNVKRGRDKSHLDMRVVHKEISEGLKYHQRISHGQRCVKSCYPCARAMSWSRDLMGLTSSVPQLVWTKGFVVVVVVVVYVYKENCIKNNFNFLADCFLVTMRSWVQVLETASYRNVGKGCLL